MINLRRRLNVPALGPAPPRRGNRFTAWIAMMCFWMTGWRFEGTVPNLPKFIIIAAPHTSNWDFVLTVGALFAIGIHVSFMVKHTLFWWPMGAYLRWSGGLPIDRRAPRGAVEEAVAAFRSRDKLVLGITPEGTRARVERWKTGFYHIAVAAAVPLLPLAFDYEHKMIRLGLPLMPTGNKEVEMAELRSFYAGIKGKYPQNFQP